MKIWIGRYKKVTVHDRSEIITNGVTYDNNSISWESMLDLDKSSEHGSQLLDIMINHFKNPKLAGAFDIMYVDYGDKDVSNSLSIIISEEKPNGTFDEEGGIPKVLNIPLRTMSLDIPRFSVPLHLDVTYHDAMDRYNIKGISQTIYGGH